MTDTSVIEKFTADGWETITDQGFVGLVGPFFSKAAGDSLQFCFPTEDRHHNRNGVVQGGALMTFADRALGATARFVSKSPRTAGIQLNFQFVASVKIGDLVEAKPTVVRDTKQLIFMSTTLTVGSQTVATAEGIWKKLAPSS